MKFLKNKIRIFTVLLLLLAAAPYADADTINLQSTIRDFQSSHPDMERSTFATDPGIVESTLGVDGKPVYASPTDTFTTTGETEFNQWYNDVGGVNMNTPFTLTLDNTITPDPNVYTFDDSSFFPIDGQLFGNEGNNHNYHFTLELHNMFTYQGGEVFSVTGDDDIWLFINDELVIDLGGVHPPLSSSVSLDTLGLTIGEDYAFDFFFAERHTSLSNLRLDTSIQLKNVPVPEPSTYLLMGSMVAGACLLHRRKRVKQS